MKQNKTDLDLIVKLTELKSTPMREPQAAARGRSKFLAEASKFRETVSQGKNQRHNGWNLIFQKESPIMKTVISVLIVILILAGTTTVFAAQDSLPNEPLYAVKTLGEDAGLWLTADPTSRLDRLMEFAHLRTQEMSALIDQNDNIPEQVALRLRLHIENALQLAASQDDNEMQASLLKIQSRLHIQEQVITQLQERASQPILEQARIMTQEQLRLANQGLADPFAFRNRYRVQNTVGPETPPSNLTGIPNGTATPNAFGAGPGPNIQETPGTGYGPNPTPGSSYGPNPTQGAGYGPNPTPGGGGSGGGMP